MTAAPSGKSAGDGAVVELEPKKTPKGIVRKPEHRVEAEEALV